MSTVDNRVVRMTFDNAQFEKNIKNTMKTLDEFATKLKLDGATAGMEKIKSATDKLDISSLSRKAGEEANKIAALASEAAKSIAGIDDGAESADFSGLSKGAMNAVSDVNNAAMGVDLSPIVDSAEEASQGFSALETVAVGALLNIGGVIGDVAMDGFNKLKNGLLGPISEGFEEYQTQVNSIQTILANTGRDFDSDMDIQEVNDALDELNLYADKTIYNFTDMTSAIGRFTAAGIGKDNLQEAVDAVQGVANVAALAGASATDVSRVLPQLAQALSAGQVSMQDWFSIETANMNSKIFVDTIADVAMHMAEVGKAEQSAYEAGDAILNQGMTIRSALNKTDNKDWAGWFSSDILAETLQMFTYDIRSATDDEVKAIKEHLSELGYQEEEFQKIFDQAAMAQKAAQDVRTWKQMWDTVGESIGSNWAGIWRNFLGDFKQATDTFTFLSNTLSGGVDTLLGGIVNAARQFNASGAIDIIFGGFKRYTQEDFDNGLIDDESLINQKILGGDGEFERVRGVLDNLVEIVTKPLGAIKDAFDEIFGMDDESLGIMLVGIAQALYGFTESLIISDDAAAGLKGIFEGLFAIVDFGITVIADLVAGFFGLVDIVRILLDPLIDLALVIGGKLGEVIVWFHDRYLEFRDALVESVSPMGNVVEIIKMIVGAFLDFVDIPGKIGFVMDSLMGLWTILWDFVDIPGKIRGIFDFIGEITGWNSAVEESDRIFNETGESVSVLDIWIQRMLSNPVVAFFKGICDAVGQAIEAIGQFFAGQQIDAESLGGIWDGVKNTIISVLTPIKDFIVLVAKGIGGIIFLSGALLGAIGGLIGRLGEAFLAWEPIQHVIELVKNFKDNVIDFFMSLPDKFSNMVGKLGTHTEGFKGLFQGIVDWFTKTTDYFKNVSVDQFIEDVRIKIDSVIGKIKGFFDNAKKIFENPEMITQAIQAMSNKVVNKISELAENIGTRLTMLFPDLAPEIRGRVNKIIETVNSFKDRFVKWISDITKDSESLPEFFGKLIEGIRQVWINKLNEIKQWISNFSLQDVLDKVFGVVSNVKDRLFDGLSSIASNIDNLFPSLDGAASRGLAGLRDTISGGISGITDTVGKIWDESESIPDFIVNLFRKIGKTIKDSILGIIDTIKSFDPQMFLDIWNDFTEGLINVANDWLPDLSPIFEKVTSTITNFFTSITKDADSWKDVFRNIGKAIDEGISHIPEIVGPAFEKVKTVIKEAIAQIPDVVGPIFEDIKTVIGDIIEWILDKLSSIPGPVGDFVDKIRGKLEELKKHVSEKVGIIASSIKEMFDNFTNQPQAPSIGFSVDGMLGGLNQPMGLDQAEDNMTRLMNLFKNFKIESIPEVVKILFETLNSAIWEKLGELKDAFMNTLKDIPEKLTPIIEGLKTVFSSENIQFLINLAKDFAAIRTAWAGASLLKSIKKLVDVTPALIRQVTNTMHPKQTKDLTESIKNLGKTLMMLAGALFIVSLIPDPWAAVGVLSAVSGVLIVMTTIAGLLEKFGAGGGDNLIKSAGSLGVFAISLLLAMYAIQKLTEFDWEANRKGLIAMGAAFVILSVVAGILGAVGGDGGGSLLKAAAAIVVLAIAMNLLIPVMQAMTQIPGETIFATMVCLGALLGALYLITSFTVSADLSAASKSIIVFSIAVGILAYALYQLNQLDPAKLMVSALAIDAVLAALFVIAKFTQGIDLMGTSLAIGVFSLAVGVLSFALYQLAQVDAAAVMISALAIDAVLAALFVIAKFTQGIDLMATSLAIGVFSLAVGVLAFALYQLAQVDGAALMAAALAIDAILVPFGVLVGILSIPALSAGAAVVLPMLALAFIALGAASIMIAYALNLAVEAITNLALAGPLLIAFVEQISQHALDFVSASVAFTAFGIALIPLGAGLLIFGAGALVAGLGLSALANGVRDFMMLLTDFPVLVQSASESTNSFISSVPEALANLWNGIVDWFWNTAIPGIGEFFSGIFTALGEFAAGFGTWWTETAWPAICQTVADFTDWAVNEGIPALMEFVGNIFTVLGDLLGQFGAWIINEGLPALGEAAASFVDWAANEGIPALLDFIDDIFETLGDLLMQLGSWIITDGIPAVGEALSNIMAEAGRLGDMLLDWARGLPDAIWRGLGAIASWAGEMGRNIVNGIIDGIRSMPNAIADAVVSLAQGAMDAVRSFLGIHSPSTAMRDQVGVYIPEGLAEGIDSNSGIVYDSGYNLGASVSDGVADGAADGFSGLGAKLKEDLQNELNAGLKEGAPKDTIQAKAKATFEGWLNSDAMRSAIQQAEEKKRKEQEEALEKSRQQQAEEQKRVDELNAAKALEEQRAKDELERRHREDMDRHQNEMTHSMGMLTTIAPSIDMSKIESEVSASNVHPIEFDMSPVMDFDGIQVPTLGLDPDLSSLMGSGLDGMSIDANLADTDIATMFEGKYTAQNDMLKQGFDQLLNGLSSSFGANTEQMTKDIVDAVNSSGNIYMDSGALVGAIAPDMDSALGLRQMMSSRGVI